MPLSRCLIRNEFKLADTGLYNTTSDKNDPGALLEGVAVAGLVGILKQLGDLAQFAAEMFHDLYEEVAAMAARGHAVKDRIHSLETHVTSVEITLLSKIDHTEIYYNTGIVWHPRMYTDENCLSPKSVPRFIRDFYEECHAPPPLHLLDKFDISGAGTCLKRFTDPSFFKNLKTIPEAVNLDAERDWKTQKLKVKGSCLRNGDNSEVLTESRAKLHQLLYEDRAKNGRKAPTRRVSFKMMNLDISRSSESYMQEFLQTMSPENSVAPETEVGYGLGSVAEDSIYFSSMDPESKPLTSVTNSYDFNSKQRHKDFTSRGKGLVFSGENKHGYGGICSSSDEIARAIDNDTDALADVESELVTDNRYRPSQGNGYRRNNEHLYSMSKKGGIYASKENSQKFIDFHSVHNSNTSDDGSGSSIQEISSSSLRGVSPYDKRRTAMEHEDGQAMLFPSTETSIEGDAHSEPLANPTFNIRNSFGEISDGFNDEKCNGQKTYGSYWADAAASALLGLNLGSVGPLSTKTQDRFVAYPLSGHQDTEGHVRSNDLLRERNFADSKYGYSHSRNWGSGQISISESDQQEVGSQCSSSVSSRYLADTSSSCEMNKMEEFRRQHDVSFMQYDHDRKPLDDNHGQISERVHLDNVNDSTYLTTSDWNSEPLIRTHSRQESLLHVEETCLEKEASNATGLKPGLDGKVEAPHEVHAGEVSSVYTDDQHSHLRSEEVETNSRTFLEAVQSDTLVFARETQQQYLCLPTSDTAAADIIMDSGYTIPSPVPPQQPNPAADTIIPTTRETTQPSVASKSIKQDPVSESNASNVTTHSKDQSSEDSELHRKGSEHDTQSPKEKIIQCVEMHNPPVRNEEITSSKRAAFMSSCLPNHEDQIPVEKPVPKLRTHQNPVTESVGGLDRSKFKKVTSRNRLEKLHIESFEAPDKTKSKNVAPNAGGRDKILEVIRAKSFNLKAAPTQVPKPIVRAPTMNIKVSAILEKANRIRQATAGSDDEDEWSD